jgi:GNAT superfamily N-acetyltransferase
MAQEVELGGFAPGALGAIVQLHGAYYARHWGFGAYFEAKVATDLAAFLTRPVSPNDRLWCARQDGRVVGAIAIDASHGAAPARPSETDAHLRWFIVAEGLQGAGLGRRLLAEALAFCRTRAFRSVYLWTFAGLDVARRLYDAHGFILAEQAPAATWGVTVTEQRFVLKL